MNITDIETFEVLESEASHTHSEKRSAKRKNKYIKSRKKKISSGRKCKICGKDASPNYFFCPSCHYRVCRATEGDSLHTQLDES